MWPFKKINQILAGVEWRASLGVLFWGWIAPAGSFALPAWATEAAGVFAEFAPLSWVVAGFVGLLSYAIAVALYGYGSARAVRSKYDANFLRATGGVDPMAKVFEQKRIYLNDFVLPSSPVVDGKTFVDCEIVGPANIFLADEYNIADVRPGRVDAVVLNTTNPFGNGFIFRNCTFRACTFHRVTLFFLPHAAESHAHLAWLNWITEMPLQQSLPGIDAPTEVEDQSPQSTEGTEVEKPH